MEQHRLDQSLISVSSSFNREYNLSNRGQLPKVKWEMYTLILNSSATHCVVSIK